MTLDRNKEEWVLHCRLILDFQIGSRGTNRGGRVKQHSLLFSLTLSLPMKFEAIMGGGKKNPRPEVKQLLWLSAKSPEKKELP